MTETLAVFPGPQTTATAVSGRSADRADGVLGSNAAWLFVTIIVLAAACQLRWSLATSLPWQCDELPVLMRNTGVAGYAANEAEARQFAPSRYTAYKGAIRSLRSHGTIAQHITTNYWTNLTVHLFGCTPAAGRVGPFVWSIVAVFGVAWAVWLVTGRLAAACLAGWVVALSPHAIAYGAQARGYAEALALTPLLIILMEHRRRRPERKLLGIAVFLCALQLSLTFYTMWIYWVFPAVAIMVVVLPRTVGDPNDRRTYTAAATVIAVGLCAAMTIFTIDRWDKLTFVASYVASSIEPGASLLHRVGTFFETLANRLLPSAAGITLIAVAGIPVLWRSQIRWWLYVMAAGVIVPMLFALANGTPGFTRTFGYLIAPISILFGLGADVVIRAIQTRLRFRCVGITAAVVLLASTAWAYPSVQHRARAILLPDWGDVVLAVNKQPQTHGRRWFCHCLANYWQIRWYQEPLDYSAVLSADAGSKIEVVMGAQLNDDGEPVVYRLSPSDGAIRPTPLPGYLADFPPSETRSGIEVRRWIGTKLEVQELTRPTNLMNKLNAVFILVANEQPFTFDQWQRFLAGTNGVAEGVVTFKSSIQGSVVIESLIAPVHLLPKIRGTLADELGADIADIHGYILSSTEAGRL